jgi:hypothetical protein
MVFDGQAWWLDVIRVLNIGNVYYLVLIQSESDPCTRAAVTSRGYMWGSSVAVRSLSHHHDKSYKDAYRSTFCWSNISSRHAHIHSSYSSLIMSSSIQSSSLLLHLQPVIDTFLGLPVYARVLSILIGFPAIAIALNVLSQVVRVT